MNLVEIVYKLNDVVEMFYKDIILVEIVCNVIDAVYKVKRVDDIVRCDLSVLQIAKELFECLLTIDNIYFDGVVKWCQQVVCEVVDICQSEISIEICCLKISSRMFTICKRGLIVCL